VLLLALWQAIDPKSSPYFPPPSAWWLGLAGLAKVRATQGKYTDAVDLLKKAIAAVPYPEYAAALGDVYQKLGNAQEAKKQYELVEFIGYLSQINQQIHNRDLALFYADHDLKLKESLELARNELEVRHDIYSWDVLAWSLYKNGKYQEAADAISHALSQGTKDAQLFFHAGMLYESVGDSAKAKSYLRQALAIAKFEPGIYEVVEIFSGTSSEPWPFICRRTVMRSRGTSRDLVVMSFTSSK